MIAFATLPLYISTHFGQDPLRHFETCRCEAQTSSRPLEFIHVPKTGGENIERLLAIKKNHNYGDHISRVQRQCPPRLKFKFGKVVLNDDNNAVSACSNQDAFYFTIVRNPYDRMWSWFKFCVHGYKGNLPGPKNAHCAFIHEELSAREPDFREFLKSRQYLQEQISQVFFLWMRKTLSLGYSENISVKDAGYIWAPYTKWISNFSTGELLVDYIIRFEDDDEILGCQHGTRSALLCALGVQFTTDQVTFRDNNSSTGILFPGVPLELLFAISENKYRHWYTPLGRALVESVFAEDFLIFGYNF